MRTWDTDRFFTTIEELVLCHSPSGVEGEVNRYIQQRKPLHATNRQ